MLCRLWTQDSVAADQLNRTQAAAKVPGQLWEVEAASGTVITWAPGSGWVDKWTVAVYQKRKLCPPQAAVTHSCCCWVSDRCYAFPAAAAAALLLVPEVGLQGFAFITSVNASMDALK